MQAPDEVTKDGSLMIEEARLALRNHLNSGRAHHRTIEHLIGSIICARILAGEIKPKLKDPSKIRIGH